MSYLDFTFTPETGYTYVNFKQIYDKIAEQLTAHAQWTFIESVDFAHSTGTFRTFVWRNNAATSGMLKDWHIAFQLLITAPSGLYETLTGVGVRIYLFEDYNSTTKVASKIATIGSSTSFTLQADQTHPLTWDIKTIRPTGAGASIFNAIVGPKVDSTSVRMLFGVTNTVLSVQIVTGTKAQVYVGAIDTLLSSTDDPFPLVLMCSETLNSSSASAAAGHGSSTRHPILAPGAMTYAFGLTSGYPNFQGTMTGRWGFNPLYEYGPYPGLLGDPATTGWSLFLSGMVISPCCVSTPYITAAPPSTRGGLRGFLRNVVYVPLATHTAGDTFVISGKTYVGMGQGDMGLWDTTA